VNPPRLVLLIGTHRYAQTLVPVLLQSRFALTHQCLEPAQLYDAIDAGCVDVALVSTGPRGLVVADLVNLARRRIPLVVLDSQPFDARWSAFPGVVLGAEAPVEVVLTGLDAALRGECLRQPNDHAADAPSQAEDAFPDGVDSAVDLPGVGETSGKIVTIVGGPGAPGRSMLALDLAALLSREAATVLVDADTAAPVLAARLGGNTNKNLLTVALQAPTTPEQWNSALSRDLQPIVSDGACSGLFLAGLPRHDSRLPEGFLDGLLEALRARFDYVVCDTGVQWLQGDRTSRVPVQLADTILLTALPEVAGVRRARHVLDRLRTFVGPVKVGVVVNQHRARRDFDRWEFEFAFGEPLSAVLPFDPVACWRAIDKREPVAFGNHRSPLSRSLVELAERLHGGRVELLRPSKTERRSPWRWPARLGGKAS
jgi:Flp pilus assembly CpaE family ATPase